MKLHNLCLDRNVNLPKKRFYEDKMTNDFPHVISNNDSDMDTLLRHRAVGDRRNNITAELEREGKERPLHSANSKA